MFQLNLSRTIHSVGFHYVASIRKGNQNIVSELFVEIYPYKYETYKTGSVVAIFLDGIILVKIPQCNLLFRFIIRILIAL